MLKTWKSTGDHYLLNKSVVFVFESGLFILLFFETVSDSCNKIISLAHLIGSSSKKFKFLPSKCIRYTYRIVVQNSYTCFVILRNTLLNAIVYNTI